MLKTRLRYGKISHEKEDVKYRMERWKAPVEMERDLLQKWRLTANAELVIYQEEITGNHVTTVTEDKHREHGDESRKGTFQSAKSTILNYLPSRIANALLGDEKNPEDQLSQD